MELSLNEQLAICRLAKKHYIRIVENNKKILEYDSFKFKSSSSEYNELYGLCHCFKKAMIMKIPNIDYISITDYIPIFKPCNIMEISKELNIKIKFISDSALYYYPLEEYRNRINLINMLIKYLQIKIKEQDNNFNK